MTGRIGTMTLGGIPRIAAVASDRDILEGSLKAFNKADFIEIRVDLFQSIEEDYVKKVCESAQSRFSQPLIGTIRAQDEGGALALTDSQRGGLYEIIIPFCSALDIEIGHSSLIKELEPFAKTYSCVVIGSYHNFRETPEQGVLEEVLNKGYKRGFDIVKIVTMAHTEEDIASVVSFLLKNKGKSLIAFAMGKTGLLTRVVTPILGSVITYGFVSASAAPGQLSVQELSSYLKVFDPRLQESS